MSRYVGRAFFSLCLVALVSCSDAASDPSARLRVTANSTSVLTLDGPLGTSLEVPAGASGSDVTIVLSVPSARRTAPSQVLLVGPQIRLTPDGATFDQPLELTIPISPSALPAGKTIDDVIVLRVATGSDVFVPLPTRRSGDAVVATTEHFCDFIPVVLVDPMVTPFGACLDRICAPSETCADCPSDCGVCLPSGDSTPPTVTSATASGPSASLPADAVFTVTFDEPLLPSSVSALAITLESPAGPIPVSFMLAGAIAVITPNVTLPHSTTFMLSVAGVRDLAGNVMTTKSSTTFVSASQSPVTRVSASPASGDVGVHPRQDLVVTFSGDVDPASFTMQQTDLPGSGCGGNVRVTDGSTCYGGSVFALSPTTLAVRPTSSLALASTVTLDVTGVTDVNGYPLAPLVGITFVVSPVDGFAYRIGRGPTMAGNRGGIAGADAACDPTGTGRRKAFLLASTRYPCVTSNCAGTETGPVDWVMQTSTTYVNAAGALLFTTDTVHPIFVGWPMPNFFFAGGLNFAWGGTNNNPDWTLGASSSCSDWTSSSGAESYGVGYENSQTSGFIAGGVVPCTTSLPHLCVDQVPATLPTLH